MAGYHSLVHGPLPLVLPSSDFNGEIKAIVEYLKKVPHEGCCIVARTHDYVEQISAQLRAKNIATCMIDPNKEWNNSNNGVKLATMHRVKGLEFDTVIVAGLCSGCFPLPIPEGLDKSAQKHWIMRKIIALCGNDKGPERSGFIDAWENWFGFARMAENRGEVE